MQSFADLYSALACEEIRQQHHAGILWQRLSGSMAGELAELID